MDWWLTIKWRDEDRLVEGKEELANWIQNSALDAIGCSLLRG